MLNISFEIDPSLIPVLIEFVHDISDHLENELAIDITFPEDDPELASAWRESLLASLKYDCQNLLLLIDHESFGHAPISLNPELAECISRACSAMRHKIRSTFLSRLSDIDLESGELDLVQIPGNLLKPYTCYAFLASIQESLVQAM